MIKSRRIRWAVHVAYMCTMGNAFTILVENLEGERPLKRITHTWDDNIKMHLREMGLESVDWIHLEQYRD
jgi:hypothetical protein